MYKLLCDVSNTGLSEEHGHNIPRGTVLDLPEEAAERLIRIGAAVINAETEDQDPVDPGEGEQDPEKFPEDLPEDLEYLKNIADMHNIPYAANIGAATLKERILNHLTGE